MIKSAQEFLRFIFRVAPIDYLYPTDCVLCGKDGVDGVCEDCELSFARVDFPFCVRCGKPLRQAYGTDSCSECAGRWKHVDRARSILIYQGGAREVLHKFKYQRRAGLGKYFASLLNRTYPNMQKLSLYFNWDLNEQPSLIVPIPIHPFKKLIRGFNQNELVLEYSSVKREIPINVSLVVRKKFTRSQVGLPENKRFENVHDAFVVNPRLSQLVEGKSVLLFDDLITTGATINSAARALKQAGTKHVFALSLFTASNI